MEPLISVIIPAYNHENYIDEALRSCSEQTYEKIEIIAIDDGSTDRTWQIICSYAEKDSRIKAFRQENCGVGLTSQRGVELASGEWITFCGSDDSFPPDAINNLVSKCCGCDLVIGDYETVKDTGERELVRLPSTRDLPFLVYHSGAAWAKLYRKQFLTENEIRFPALSLEEDTVFLSLLIMHKPRFSVVKKSTYFYWNHNLGEKSLTRRLSASLYADRVKGKTIALENMRKGGFSAARERYYLMYTQQLLKQLQAMFDDDDREKCLGVFREFVLSNYEEKDDSRLELLTGMSRSDFEKTDYASLLSKQLLQDKREAVANEFALGQAGLKYIARYFRLWYEYKVEKKGIGNGS